MTELSELILPMLAFFLVILPFFVLYLVSVNAKNKRTEMQSINSQSFEKFAKEIREENTSLKSELIEIKENLASINKMLKDVE